MSAPFNSLLEISDPSKLFGRKLLLEQLAGLAKRRSCVQLIGCKRVGKTSLLKCLVSKLASEENNTLYPIYIDIKEVCSEVAGTANVYRFLIAKLMASMCKDGIHHGGIHFREIEMTFGPYWETNFENVQTITSVQLPGLFEEITCFFSDLLGKTFVFLFDEYEYLFKYCFDRPTGFMKLRNLASKSTENGISPFTFFVAGNMTWEKLCSITGSGEMNCIDSTVRVSAIDFESFGAMWEYEISKMVDCPREILFGRDFVYNASGGIPYYGKIIATKWLNTSVSPTFSDITSHLSELYNSFELEEKHILSTISNGESALPNSIYLNELKDYGLIGLKADKHEIKFLFLQDFIKSNQFFSNYKNEKNIPDSYLLTDEIAALIVEINKTCKNKGGGFIFEPLNEDQSLFKDLKAICISYEQFVNFSCSLYRVVFEKTKKDKKNKGNFPEEFTKGNKFLEATDTMRHTLGKGHLEEKLVHYPDQMSKREMLLLLTGSTNEPSKTEDFSSLQLKTLAMFKDELEKLRKIVNDK
jgi:hypothetical protein